MSEKKIVAWHDCFPIHQRFVIYEDGTATMFALPFDSDRGDVFHPSEKVFALELHRLFEKKSDRSGKS